jgi:hypothetical protein
LLFDYLSVLRHGAIMEPEEVGVARLAGAATIAEKAKKLAAEAGVELVGCTWEIGDDFADAHVHKLDIATVEKSVRIYFPDIELTDVERNSRSKRTEGRLRNAISQLLTRSPPSTYEFE